MVANSVFAVPIEPGVAHQAVISQCGERSLRFELLWSDRGGFWTLYLGDAATDSPIVDGVPLVMGLDVLKPYNLGLGSLYLLNTIDRSDPTLESLGDTVALIWEP